MKTLNETFTEEEYESIKKVKEKSGKSWHDFIISAAEKMDKKD